MKTKWLPVSELMVILDDTVRKKGLTNAMVSADAVRSIFEQYGDTYEQKSVTDTPVLTNVNQKRRDYFGKGTSNV